MSFWKEKYIFSLTNPFVLDVVWYGRYFDDLIFMWGRDVVSISHFHQHANSNDLNLKFTCAFSQSRVHFLDLTVEGNVGEGKIFTSIFCKPDAGSTILNAQSSHLKHILEAIPVGEYFRLKRACSSDLILESQMKSLGKRLHQRGYKKWHTDRSRHKVNNRTRKALLFD